MLKLYNMKERILEFLRSENKSSSQLADEIGVQPSGISHIISGRNNPSLDFVVKMLDKYKYLSTDWLLFGKGKMYKEGQTQMLFEETVNLKNESEIDIDESTYDKEKIDFIGYSSKKPAPEAGTVPITGDHKVIKIVWFYDNNSFEEYLPRG
jgi:transcriptional regulator with XRE-family HTH domain